MIRDEIGKILVAGIKKIWGADFPLSEIIIVERPKNDKMGDFASSAAFVLGKIIKETPFSAAQKIVKVIEGEKEYFSKVEAVDPGFINFHLSDEFLQNQVEEILKQREDYGKNNWGQNKKVQVEFISANPTGPLTLGNGRGGVYGDILGNVFKKAGYDVVKEYYINDAGGQIEKLGHSVLKDEEAEYKGDYIDELARQIQDQDPKIVGQKAQAIILEQIKKTVTAMGIKFDEWFSEQKELRDTGKVEEVFNLLKKQKLAYEQEGALWFAAEKFGDEKDRPLKKSDGEPTYFGVDCAYHYNKFTERGFTKVINVWGADHHGDVARVKGFVKSLGLTEDSFEILLMQFVRLVQGGQEVRMSKRKGVYITVDEVLVEVGRDAFRFFMAMYSSNTHMDFDLALAKEQSQKNPVYYAQYGHARIKSILARAEDRNEKGETDNLKSLKAKEELNLIRQLVKYPEIVADTARDYQVQRVPQYVLGLVAAFHKFYENCRVLSEEKNLQDARLQLVRAAQIILFDLLENILGVSAPDKM